MAAVRVATAMARHPLREQGVGGGGSAIWQGAKPCGHLAAQFAPGRAHHGGVEEGEHLVQSTMVWLFGRTPAESCHALCGQLLRIAGGRRAGTAPSAGGTGEHAPWLDGLTGGSGGAGVDGDPAPPDGASMLPATAALSAPGGQVWAGLGLRALGAAAS